MSDNLTRRAFLRDSALAGSALWLTFDGPEAAAAKPKSPNERLNVGAVGVGGKGNSNVNACAGENIVALCDVDQKRGGRALSRYGKAAKYDDFRKMLDKEKLDAVLVSTPDHTHAVAALDAMSRGLHVYCEKPLTWSIQEARAMTELARKKKLATQMGNQGTSTDGLRKAVGVVQGGVIGDVKEVHIWTNRPIWPQGMGGLAKATDVPGHLKWDLWLGPAAARGYNKAYLPFKWRGWWDFGTGALGDMACHTANMAFMALKLGAPTKVTALKTVGGSEVSPPKKSIIRYEFPARGDMPPVTVTWYDGGFQPPRSLVPGVNRFTTSGSLLVGEKGVLYSPNDYGASFGLHPREKFEGVELPASPLPKSPGHHREWLAACKGGEPAVSNFDYAGPLTEFVLLGNVALRVGKEVVWDAEKMTAKGCPEADRFVRREYRKGWSIDRHL